MKPGGPEDETEARETQLAAELRKNEAAGRTTELGGDANCMEMSRHKPHAWTYPPEWGPRVWHVYWCHGIKDITIERYEA